MTLEQLRQKYNALIDSKNHNEVIEVCTQIIQLDPNNAKVFYNRGNAYTGLKQFEKAIQDYNEAIKLNSEFAEAFNNRGNAYTSLKQFEKAIQDYNKAIELDPQDAEAFNNRGNAYTDLKQFEKAIQDYNKAIELDPQYAEAFNNRGNAYTGLKQFEKAIQDYNEAIKLNSEFAEAFNNRGNAYTSLKQFEKAIQDYNKAIELDPQDAKTFYNRGLTYRVLGEEEEAIQDFKEAQKLDPSIIAKEQIKALEKEFEEKIQQTQDSNEEVQGFQTILEDLKEEHQTEEVDWFKWSKGAVGITLGLIVLALVLVSCGFLESGDTYIVYIFSSIVTFTIIRQYTNAKALRIEASNRVAMAKMFERVKHENNDYQTEFLPKLVDAIVYSTTKEKNNADGLVEKIINGLTKLKK